jgi:hypothetical protein
MAMLTAEQIAAKWLANLAGVSGAITGAYGPPPAPAHCRYCRHAWLYPGPRCLTCGAPEAKARQVDRPPVPPVPELPVQASWSDRLRRLTRSR